MAQQCGPTSPEGKAASSRNALKHGLTSLHPIVTDEDRPDYEALHDNLFGSLQPVGHLQEHTFQRLVNAAWNMQRCLKLEHMVMECIGGIDPLAHPEAAQQAALFERYYLRFEGSYRANLRELERLQRLQLAQDVHFGDENPVGALHDLQLYQRLAKRNGPLPQAAPQPAQHPQPPSDQQSAKQIPIRRPKIGRNEPCPCGSGNKYKRCCGFPQTSVLDAA
jgi:hypothetical protein